MTFREELHVPNFCFGAVIIKYLALYKQKLKLITFNIQAVHYVKYTSLTFKMLAIMTSHFVLLSNCVNLLTPSGFLTYRQV